VRGTLREAANRRFAGFADRLLLLSARWARGGARGAPVAVIRNCAAAAEAGTC